MLAKGVRTGEILMPNCYKKLTATAANFHRRYSLYKTEQPLFSSVITGTAWATAA
jgi:hypothetical protein